MPLLQAARSPPAMPRSLPPGRRCLSHDDSVALAYVVFPRDPRSPKLCHHSKVSAATAAAWQANERPLAILSGGRQVRHMSVFRQASAVLLEPTARSVNRKVTAR